MGGEVARLTPRQSDVLALVARGLSNKEIARDLELAEGTVKLHVTALLKALGVNNCTQAVVKENVLSFTSLHGFHLKELRLSNRHFFTLLLK